MRVSSRTDYGVRALFDLAQRFGQGPTQSRDIASRQRVPEAYLHQVLGALNRAGLIRSTRGPQGGHELARDPARINLWEIWHVLDGTDRRAHPHPHPEGVPASDIIHAVWHEVQCQSEAQLRAISLDDLLARHAAAAAAANYSI